MPDFDDDKQKRQDAQDDIAALKALYARRADAVFRTPGPASASALADLFTTDGVLDLGPFGRYEGRNAIRQACEQVLPQATKWSTHYIVSPILDVAKNGETATGSWYFLIKSVPQQPPQSPVIEIMGGYEDKYRREDGRWKIRETISVFFIPPT
jgi:hypothetical protein